MRRLALGRLTRLTVGGTRLTWLPVGLTRLARLAEGRLPGLAVRRLTWLLAVPGRRSVRGLARLAVLRLTELAWIWLPVCHGVSVGMRSCSAEGR